MTFNVIRVCMFFFQLQLQRAVWGREEPQSEQVGAVGSLLLANDFGGGKLAPFAFRLFESGDGQCMSAAMQLSSNHSLAPSTTSRGGDAGNKLIQTPSIPTLNVRDVLAVLFELLCE